MKMQDIVLHPLPLPVRGVAGRVRFFTEFHIIVTFIPAQETCNSLGEFLPWNTLDFSRDVLSAFLRGISDVLNREADADFYKSLTAESYHLPWKGQQMPTRRVEARRAKLPWIVPLPSVRYASVSAHEWELRAAPLDCKLSIQPPIFLNILHLRKLNRENRHLWVCKQYSLCNIKCSVRHFRWDVIQTG